MEVSEESQRSGSAVPPHIRQVIALIGSTAILNAAERVPFNFWSQSLGDAEARARPSKVSYDLREAFWRALKRCLRAGNKVQLVDLARDAGCSYAHAYQLLTGRPEVLAWILLPANDLRDSGESLLRLMFDEMREILDLPIADKNGQVLVKNANMKLKVWSLLDERYGSRMK